jgi:voltage-gated potassium channel
MLLPPSGNRPFSGHEPYHRAIARMHSNAEEVRYLIYLVLLLFSIGTMGFVLIEGWSVADAIYMTVVTLSTVGYGEVQPLSPLGRAFTTGLILAGVGVAAYSFTFITRAVVEGEIKRFRGYNKMKKQIDLLQGHTILCGWGRLGKRVGKALLEEGERLVVVENNSETLISLQDTGILCVSGSASEEEVLKAAGIERAKTILAILPADAENVYTILCARELNPDITIIARSEEETGEKRLIRAGANQVIAPYRVSGFRIAQQLIRPHVSDFLQITTSKSGPRLALEEVVVPEGSSLGGKTLESSRLRQETGVIIAAIIPLGKEMIYNPGRESLITEGSTLIVLGDGESLDKLNNFIAN